MVTDVSSLVHTFILRTSFVSMYWLHSRVQQVIIGADSLDVLMIVDFANVLFRFDLLFKFSRTLKIYQII